MPRRRPKFSVGFDDARRKLREVDRAATRFSALRLLETTPLQVTAGLVRSGHRVPVAEPPIDPAEQFLGTKSEPSEPVRALCRCIATDPVAIDDIDLAAVEPCSSLGTHLAMWEADGARNVASGVRIAGTGVDHDDVGKCGSEINGQVPRISMEA